LNLLPEDVAAAAQVYANGEVSWPINDAERAIHALADAGLLILGLDVRQVDNDERIREVAWSSFNPPSSDDRSTALVAARDAALEALRRPDTHEFGDRILITWRPLPPAAA
jgi:hypothetical protein